MWHKDRASAMPPYGRPGWRWCSCRPRSAPISRPASSTATTCWPRSRCPCSSPRAGRTRWCCRRWPSTSSPPARPPRPPGTTASGTCPTWRTPSASTASWPTWSDALAPDQGVRGLLELAQHRGGGGGAVAGRQPGGADAPRGRGAEAHPAQPWAGEDEGQVGEEGDAQANGDEGLHRVVVVAAEREAGLEAGRPAAVARDGAIGAARGAADPGLVGELLERDRGAAGQGVAVGHGE